MHQIWTQLLKANVEPFTVINRVFKWREREVESVAILRAGLNISYLSFPPFQFELRQRSAIKNWLDEEIHECEVLDNPENGNVFYSHSTLSLSSLKYPGYKDQTTHKKRLQISKTNFHSDHHFLPQLSTFSAPAQ